MDKPILGQIPLATVLLSYIFVTGYLYLIGYWGVFGVDFLSIASVTDICKGFCYPFLMGNVYAILELLLIKLIEAKKRNSIDRPKKKWNRFIIFTILIIVVVGLKCIPTNPRDTWILVIQGILLTSAFILLVKRWNILTGIVSNIEIRGYLVTVFVATFFLSYFIGGIRGVKRRDKITKRVEARMLNVNDTLKVTKDSLKYLGYLGDKVILSALDNKTIYIFDQSVVDALEVQIKSDTNTTSVKMK